MKRRPLPLTILSLLVLGIAISFPVQIMVRFGIPPTEPGAIADKLAPLNWFVMILGFVFSVLLFRAAAMARTLAPVFLLLLAWNNWLVMNLDSGQNADLVMLGTVLVFAATAVLLFPEVRKVLMNPSLRWWQTPVRKKVTIPARIRPVHGGAELLAQTFDMSEEGVFFAVDNWGIAPTRSLNIGTHCTVVLDLARDRKVNGIARIVRHSTEANGKYPVGFAVYFEGLEQGDRARLKEFVRNLRD